MCPSTEASEAERRFADGVLRDLLQHIESENRRTPHSPYAVSHAWTAGSLIYVVYTAPPSDGTWGLVRDTRQSIIDPGPWQSSDQPALYYYLIDFEENQPSSTPRQGDPGTIWWFGFPRDGLILRTADLAPEHQYTQPAAPKGPSDDAPPCASSEPRRYGNRI